VQVTRTSELLSSSAIIPPVDPIREDFRKFLWFIWKNINLPDPTEIQYDIAKFLQSGPDKICIEAFRGVGKSFITAAFVIWLLYRDPQLKIMVVSASKNRADNFVTFTLQLINSIPEFAHLRPKPGQRQSRIEFDVGPATADQSPSVFAKGIDSQLTGGRADIIISDDVEVVNNSMTMDMRDKLVEKTKEYSAILKPLPTSRIIYLGTPQTEDSIYNKLPVTFLKRIWPAQIPTPDEMSAYGDDLAPLVLNMCKTAAPGDPVDPARFDMDDLMARRAEYGAAGYQLQFMLNTKLSDEERYPLKLKNLIVSPVPPVLAPYQVHWLPNPDRMLRDLPTNGMAGDRVYSPAGTSDEFGEYQHRAMSIDPSGRGADETSYGVGFQLAGNIWIPDAGGFAGGYETETLNKLAKIAKKHKVQTIVVESNFGDGMFERLLEPILAQHKVKAEVIGVRHHTMKELRILDVLEPVISAHKLIVDPSVLESDNMSINRYDTNIRIHKSLFHQMTHICRERGALRHDDRIDALAMLVAYFVELMNQDAARTAMDQRDEKLRVHLAGFHKGVLLGHNGGPKIASWNSNV